MSKSVPSRTIVEYTTLVCGIKNSSYNPHLVHITNKALFTQVGHIHGSIYGDLRRSCSYHKRYRMSCVPKCYIKKVYLGLKCA